MVQEGVDVTQIDAVLITHGHSDHSGGLPMLLQAAWLAGRTRPLPIHLPGELIAPLDAWLEAVYLPASLLTFPLEWRSWNPSETVSLSPAVSVSIFRTSHLDGLKRRFAALSAARFEVFGLDIRWGGRRVICSSDLGSPADLLPVLSGHCDVLVCELSHFPQSDLHEVLRSCSIGTLLLNHLAPELNGRESEVVQAAQQALPHIGNIRAVRDGERVEF